MAAISFPVDHTPYLSSPWSDNATGKQWTSEELLDSDGNQVIRWNPYLSASTGGVAGVTSVSGTGTVSGLTLTGTVTSTGSLTLGGTLAVTTAAITDLSSWTGSAAITTLGTISTGTWNGSIIGPAYLGTGADITTKYLRGDGTWQTLSGGGDASTSGTLAQFAATTSAQLAGVISDETGSGALVFATSPTLVTPALGTPTSGNFSTGTFTWPTFNQNTTGSAATLTTPRAINGTNFDGSAAITITAAAGTLTGTTLNATVTASSLLSAAGGSFGTAAFTAATAYAAASHTHVSSEISDAASAPTASVIPIRNAAARLEAAGFVGHDIDSTYTWTIDSETRINATRTYYPPDASGTFVLTDSATGKANLANGVTGTLPIANGGTGLATLGTAGQVLKVNAGATALEYATASGSGDLLSTNNLSDLTNAATARTNLGSGAVGDAVFVAATIAAFRDAIRTKVVQASDLGSTSTTFAATDLVLTLTGGVDYHIKASVQVVPGSATSGAKIQLIFSQAVDVVQASGAGIGFSVAGVSASAIALVTTTRSDFFSYTGAVLYRNVVFHFFVRLTATGTVTVNFAQVAAEATGSVFKAGSWITSEIV